MPNPLPQILWLDPADFLGGAELFSLDLLPPLAPDFHITVLTNDLNSEFGWKLPETVRREGFAFPRLKPLGLKTLFRFWRTGKLLRRYIRKHRFDLIQTNSIRAHILAAQALRGMPMEQRPRLVFFVHDFTFPKWAVLFFAPLAEQILACSEAVKEDLRLKGVEASRIEVIPNGVDMMRFAKIHSHSFTPKQPVIGIIGRIDRWKGQDVFLSAAELVRKTYPRAQFKIFGQSSTHDPQTIVFEQELWALVKEKNLEQNVEFCGFVPPEKALAEIDILVHASTAPEPFGRVILEGLAAGVPVIASRLGGPAEIFENGIAGILIEPGDSELLAQKILLLLGSKELREQFAARGKELVTEYFQLSHIARKLTREWKKLLPSS